MVTNKSEQVSCEHLRRALCGIRQGPERFEKICLETFLVREQLIRDHTMSIRSKQLRRIFQRGCGRRSSVEYGSCTHEPYKILQVSAPITFNKKNLQISLRTKDPKSSRSFSSVPWDLTFAVNHEMNIFHRYQKH